FAANPELLPTMSFDTTPPRWTAPRHGVDHEAVLYAIVDSAARVRQVLTAGARTVQLRIKQTEASRLREEIRAGVAACRRAGAGGRIVRRGRGVRGAGARRAARVHGPGAAGRSARRARGHADRSAIIASSDDRGADAIA